MQTYSAYKYDIKSIAADYYVVKSSDLDELNTKLRQSIGRITIGIIVVAIQTLE